MKIVILGSGNVASILAPALAAAGYDIVQVWSRNIQHAAALAKKVDALSTDNIDDLAAADLYLIAVSDQAIPSLLSQLRPNEGIVVHTSGATPLSVFNDRFEHCGVFYPFQTFSKARSIDFSQVPILLEASDSDTFQVMESIAKQISECVRSCNSKQREAAHLAAAFACNFTNHLYAVADKLLGRAGLDFEVIRPLIHETALKALEHHPDQVQTGPAARGDRSTIEHHLDLLKDDKELSDIYTLLTYRIIAAAKST